MHGLFEFRVAYLEGQKTAEVTLPTCCVVIEWLLKSGGKMFQESIGSHVFVVAC